MRELILKMSVSLDSFVAGADGEIGWVFGGDEEASVFAQAMNEILKAVFSRPGPVAQRYE